MRRIVVDPPQSDARRERVEKKLFERLAAVRVVERAEAVIPPERTRRMPLWLAGGALAAAAVIALVVLRSDPAREGIPAPSRIVTPVGGTSQVTLPGALIEARSDTSVEVQHGPDGAITLVVARGTVECDVEPRGNRPPFKVVAGDVLVEVVGTRFTVARTPAPRVDVARGKVRVTAPGGQWLVEAGEAWPDPSRTASASVPLPAHEPEVAAESEVAPDVVAAPAPAVTREPARTAPSHKKAAAATRARDNEKASAVTERERARESYKIAIGLEATDPDKAAALYRAIATDGKGMESVALVSLAELQLRRKQPAAALATLDEYGKRFPSAANAEDAAWFRYEALRTMGKRDEARGAAADYLRKFPNGTYADRFPTPAR
jgi:ferric-dicitrate binding protein FerR (iron transport regulator)